MVDDGLLLKKNWFSLVILILPYRTSAIRRNCELRSSETSFGKTLSPRCNRTPWVWYIPTSDGCNTMSCAQGPLGGQEAPPRPEDPQQDPPRRGMELIKTADTFTWAMLRMKNWRSPSTRLQCWPIHGSEYSSINGLDSSTLGSSWVPNKERNKKTWKTNQRNNKGPRAFFTLDTSNSKPSRIYFLNAIPPIPQSWRFP